MKIKITAESSAVKTRPVCHNLDIMFNEKGVFAVKESKVICPSFSQSLQRARR
jgi:hypothetical protein